MNVEVNLPGSKQFLPPPEIELIGRTETHIATKKHEHGSYNGQIDFPD